MAPQNSRPHHPGWVAMTLGLVVACGGGGASNPGFSPSQGELVAKPGGGYFLADPHSGGRATRVRLLEMGWGRLVDVYDVDALGARNPIPVLRDVVIGESWAAGGTDLRFETAPVSNRGRLTILRPRDAPEGDGSFESILRRVSILSPVLPKGEDGFPPLSLIARNATLVLRFDDLLADGPEELAGLHESVRLLSGYPPVVPQPARVVFDPSHGGLAQGGFHSTRVLIDFTVSEEEALEVPDFVPVNPIGLPGGARPSRCSPTSRCACPRASTRRAVASGSSPTSQAVDSNPRDRPTPPRATCCARFARATRRT